MGDGGYVNLHLKSKAALSNIYIVVKEERDDLDGFQAEAEAHVQDAALAANGASDLAAKNAAFGSNDDDDVEMGADSESYVAGALHWLFELKKAAVREKIL